jgi:hypothetical protein
MKKVKREIICVPVYYALGNNGKRLIDEESIRDEFEEKLKMVVVENEH